MTDILDETSPGWSIEAAQNGSSTAASLAADQAELAAFWRRFHERGVGGRPPLDELLAAAYVEQADRMMAEDRTLTRREAAIRLFVNYADLGDDSLAEASAEDAAERKLRRYARMTRNAQGQAE